ncbi:MAG: ABC transporter ATP-binding protein, partial [Pseudomonadota bacterium]|nr:ABC transporter ATP-binding protein [Pseudomonadota bacterium]
MSTQTPALLISGLQKTYGNLDVLKGVNLTLTSGSIQGLVGLNGSGKTTTLECILGLQRFDQGEVSVLGLVPTDLCTAQGKVTAVFDSPSLNPNLTVRQCLQHASLLSKQSRRHPKDLEKLLGLCQFSNFPIKTLSLGNKRRASIAHALISEPDLVIMDEPFNGLDAGGVDEVLLL